MYTYIFFSFSLCNQTEVCVCFWKPPAAGNSRENMLFFMAMEWRWFPGGPLMAWARSTGSKVTPVLPGLRPPGQGRLWQYFFSCWHYVGPPLQTCLLRLERKLPFADFFELASVGKEDVWFWNQLPHWLNIRCADLISKLSSRYPIIRLKDGYISQCPESQCSF